MKTPPRPGQAGFTLIELLVVLTVLGIMMGIAIPSFRNFIASQRIKSAATELMTTALMARSEAIKRNVSTGVTITPDASGWAGGWVAAYSGTQVHAQGALEAITVTTYSDSTCATAATVASVTFGPNGRAGAGSCFKFESNSTGTSRCVKLDLTGIPSSGSCP